MFLNKKYVSLLEKELKEEELKKEKRKNDKNVFSELNLLKIKEKYKSMK